MIIALVGIDGSGKSTQAIRLVKALKERGIQCRYFHPYFKYIFLSKLFRVFSGTTEVLRARKNSFSNEKNSGLLKLWPILTFLDNIVTYFINMRRLRRDFVLICDRYFIDNIVTFVTEGVCNKNIARFLLAFIPKPDILFWLDLPPVVALERKREYPLSVYQKLRNNYVQLLSSFMPQRIVIDAEKPISDISSIILNHYVKLAGIAQSKPTAKNT